MARPIRIASCTVPLDPVGGQRDAALALVDQAGAAGTDIICLPEWSASPADEDGNYLPITPGVDDTAFSSLAKKHSTYLVAPIVEAVDDGGLPYNSAVLYDRRGEVVGVYRKTHLCLPGFAEGTKFRPGDELPVFETDFGTVGIAICMDLHYPELFGVLAQKGAEVILWPSAAMDYTGDVIESVVNARAFDNQTVFVCSHFVQTPYLVGRHYGRSRIVDPMGRIRADTGHHAGVAHAVVDLDDTYDMWYTGEMKDAYPTMREVFRKTRRPELYGPVAEPDAEAVNRKQST